MSDIWIEKEKYWVSNCPQLSSMWFRVRRARVTGSMVGTLLRHSKFKTVEETIDTMLGVRKDSTNNAMARGIRLEPNARRWLEKTIGKSITEVGLCVPKWDSRIGASVDGVIDVDTICEIKIPNTMYKPLIYHRDKMQRDYKFDKYYHNHIWDNHYDQMQLGMAVLGAKYCYYTVYLPSEDEDIPEDYYVEKILFNETYWLEMYDKISEIYNTMILPRIEKTDRIDP